MITTGIETEYFYWGKIVLSIIKNGKNWRRDHLSVRRPCNKCMAVTLASLPLKSVMKKPIIITQDRTNTLESKTLCIHILSLE